MIDSFAASASRTSAPVSYDPRSNRWMLTSDFSHEVEGYTFRIASGFVFDLASVPRFVWRWIAPHELSVEAALIHDFLYRRGGWPELDECRPWKKFSRKQADDLFRAEMICRGVASWRRQLAYWAVRLFGRRAWRG